MIFCECSFLIGPAVPGLDEYLSAVEQTHGLEGTFQRRNES